MFPAPPATASTIEIAQIIQLCVAPIFLLAGVGAFLNVCTGRLSRIVDLARALEPRVLATRGAEQTRLLDDIRALNRRMGLVSWAIALSVMSALLICLVIVLLFAGSLAGAHFRTAVALLFIASMIAIGSGFAAFLIETRIGLRAARVQTELLQHRVDDAD
jgi:methylthioribose-1-phosphate isomerase